MALLAPSSQSFSVTQVVHTSLHHYLIASKIFELSSAFTLAQPTLKQLLARDERLRLDAAAGVFGHHLPEQEM